MLRDRAGAYTLANLRLQRSANQPLDRFLSELGSVGRVGIVGGAVRDWFTGRQPRDLDVVADATQDELDSIISLAGATLGSRTRLGGRSLTFGSLKVDAWSLSASWGFRHDRSIAPSLENLPTTAFLTADAIVVDAENGETFDAGFFDCFVRRELDVLSDHLPFGLAVTAVARSLVLSDEHALSISSRLSQFICRAAARGIRWPLIEKEQFERYGRVLVTGSEARYLLRSSPNAFRELVAEAAAHPRGFTQAA